MPQKNQEQEDMISQSPGKLIAESITGQTQLIQTRLI